jgi:hypothetical protein
VDVTLYDANGTVLSALPSAPGSSGVYFFGCQARHVSPCASATQTRSRPRPQAKYASNVRALVSAGDCRAGVSYAKENCPLKPVALPPWRISVGVQSAVTLTLSFVNCGGATAALGASYALLNPDGYLSTQQQPLPAVYLAFALAWLLCLLLFARLVRRHGPGAGEEGRIGALQRALLSVVLLKVVYLAAAAGKWFYLNRTGRSDESLAVLLVVAQTVSQTDLLGVLLLLSRSWQLSRGTLGAPERSSLLLSLLLLASLFFVSGLWSPKSLFALAVAYVCVLGFAFAGTFAGLRHLKAQAQLLRISGSGEETELARCRVHIFAGLHSSLLLFTVAQLVLHLVSLFVTSSASIWLSPFFSEVVDLSVALAVGWLYRPRTPSPFCGEDAAEALRQAAGSIVSAGQGGGAVFDSERLGRIMTALRGADPAREEDARGTGLSEADGERRAAEARLPVLVENPCTVDSVSGLPVTSVSVGLPQAKPEEEVRRDSLLREGGALETEAGPAGELSAADRFRLLWGAPGMA